MSMIQPTTIQEFLCQYSNNVKEAIEEIDEAIKFAETKMLLQNEESPMYQTMIDCMEIIKQQLKNEKQREDFLRFVMSK